MQTDTAMSHAQPAIEPLLNVFEAGRLVNLSVWTIRHHIRNGRIRAVRIGRRLLVEPSELRRVIAAGRVQ